MYWIYPKDKLSLLNMLFCNFSKSDNSHLQIMAKKAVEIWKIHWIACAWIFCFGNIWLFRENNRNIRKRCEMYSKLTIKATKRRCSKLRIMSVWRQNDVSMGVNVYRSPSCHHSGGFIANLQRISHFFLIFICRWNMMITKTHFIENIMHLT